MYSILQKDQKSRYLLVCTRKHIIEPYKTEYKVTEIIKDDLYRVDFNLGFREPTKINLMFRSDQRHGKKGEVDITSRYESLSKNNIIGDFKFVLSEVSF
jgi:KUP system potassium uptake protein